MKIRFTASARSQFKAVLEYIKRGDADSAVRFRRKVEQTLRRLERFPRSGRVLPEFPELSYREVIVGPYRFFYRERDGAVWIVAVWHGAQMPKEPES